MNISFCPVPTPVVSIPDPGPLFVSTSPQLSCTVNVNPTVDVPVSASVEWDGPRGTSFAMSSGVLTTTSVTFFTTLTDAMATDSGNYTCTVTISSNSSVYGLAITSHEGAAQQAVTICESFKKLLSVICS